MKYNLSNEYHLQQAKDRFTKLEAAGAIIELTEKRFKSPSQNNYFHLALAFFGMELGYTTNEAKQICKNYPCKDIFWREKNSLKICRSTAELTKEEIGIVIDRFIKWAAIECGISIPPADRTQFWAQFEIEASRNKYL